MFTHRVEAGGSIIKGALCSFGQETLIGRERSLLIVCLVCLLIRIKQTDFKRTISWRTLPPFYRQLVYSVMVKINISVFVLLPH